MNIEDEALEAAARAHDTEDAAQKGEPSPWRYDLVAQHIEQNGQEAHDEWVSERLHAMRAGVTAYLAAIAPAVPDCAAPADVRARVETRRCESGFAHALGDCLACGSVEGEACKVQAA